MRVSGGSGGSAGTRASVAGWARLLRARVEERRAAGLARACVSAPAGLIDLSSNDYLGLRRHPRVVEAAAGAAREYGAGAGASRLAGGTCELHERVERRFAEWKGAESALIFPTGYAANIALMTALAGAGDLILFDKRSHASVIDAVALATGADRGEGRAARLMARSFVHRDIERARALALRFLERGGRGTVWIVTESVFSMDGDAADLRGLAALRDELTADGAGAALVVDEAHAVGVLGETGAGGDEAAGHVADICVTTGSKALGSLGGVVTGPRIVREAIEHFARPFIYTTAAAPPQVAAMEAAMDVMREAPERRRRLLRVCGDVREGLRRMGWDCAPFETDPTPIIPLITGSADSALEAREALREKGVFAPAIRPPTVAPGTSRIRLSLRADLTDGEVERILAAAGHARRRLDMKERSCPAAPVVAGEGGG